MFCRVGFRTIVLWILVCWVGTGHPADGAEKNEQRVTKTKVDALALARLLLKDGHLDRAEAVLARVNPKTKGLSLAELYTLRGVIALRRKDFVKSVLLLKRAARAPKFNPMVFLFLAQSHFRLRHYGKALLALSKAPAKAQKMPGTILLKAQSLWFSGRHHRAYAWVCRGRQRFPQRLSFHRLQALWLLRLGLLQQGQQEALRVLSRERPTPALYLLLAEALRKRGALAQAIVWLERACLQFP
ncbi:MAG: hypothetical protein AAGJ35_01995, partial [Myxococcota bacterium]